MTNFNFYDSAKNIIDHEVIKEGAEALYQLFQAYCEAGFSESQALYIVAYIMTHPIRNGGDER